MTDSDAAACVQLMADLWPRLRTDPRNAPALAEWHEFFRTARASAAQCLEAIRGVWRDRTNDYLPKVVQIRDRIASDAKRAAAANAPQRASDDSESARPRWVVSGRVMSATRHALLGLDGAGLRAIVSRHGLPPDAPMPVSAFGWPDPSTGQMAMERRSHGAEVLRWHHGLRSCPPLDTPEGTDDESHAWRLNALAGALRDKQLVIPDHDLSASSRNAAEALLSRHAAWCEAFARFAASRPLAPTIPAAVGGGLPEPTP